MQLIRKLAGNNPAAVFRALARRSFSAQARSEEEYLKRNYANNEAEYNTVIGSLTSQRSGCEERLSVAHRKRTLDALERRFAQAEAEHRTKQQQNVKRHREDKKERSSASNKSPSMDAATKKPPSMASSQKGNNSLSGHTSKQDAEMNQPAYSKLSHPVDENLLAHGAANTEICDRKLAVDHILHELFRHGDSAQKYMHGSKSMKIENTILLDNYVQKSAMSSRARVLQNGSKRSKKHMSSKQHKRNGSFDLHPEFHNYEIFKPLHEKWKSYVLQLLKITGKDNLAQCFLNADLHGAVLLVVQCNISAYSGIQGIMVRETKETFGIISPDNKFRVIPKKFSVFMLQADSWKITLHGDRLASRNMVP